MFCHCVFLSDCAVLWVACFVLFVCSNKLFSFMTISLSLYVWTALLSLSECLFGAVCVCVRSSPLFICFVSGACTMLNCMTCALPLCVTTVSPAVSRHFVLKRVLLPGVIHCPAAVLFLQLSTASGVAFQCSVWCSLVPSGASLVVLFL